LTKQYLDTVGSHLAIVRLPFHSPRKADKQHKKASELLTSTSPSPQPFGRTYASGSVCPSHLYYAFSSLTISLLPILQDRLLVHCPSSIKEERPSQPIRIRFRDPQTRLYPFHWSISRNNNRMALQRFPLLRKQAIRWIFY